MIGRADLIVDPKLASGFQSQLRKQITSATGGKAAAINLDTSGVQRAARDVEKHVGGLKGTFDRFQKSANTALGKVGLDIRSLSLALGAGFLAGDVVAIALRGIVNQTREAIQAASNLKEAQDATNVIFREGAESVREFGRNAARDIGLSERAALDAANSFEALFSNITITGEEAAFLSEQTTRLAADIASLRNLDIGETATSLRSLLSGETESGRRIGVFTNVEVAEQFAREQGLIGVNEQLDIQSRRLVFLLQALQQSRDAFGNFNTTAEEYANVTRRQEAVSENLHATIGTKLIPTVIALKNAWIGVLAFADGALTAQQKAANVNFGQVPPVEDKSVATDPVSQLFLSPVLGEIIDFFGRRGKKIQEALAKEQRELLDSQEFEETIRREIQQNQAMADSNIKAVETQIDAVRKVPAAELGVRQARLAVEQATLGVIRAEDRLSDVRKEIARQGQAISEAELGVTQARLRQEQTRLDTADILSGIDRQERQLDVTLSVQEATLGLASAQEAQAKSANALTQASSSLFSAQLKLVGLTKGRRQDPFALHLARLEIAEAQGQGGSTRNPLADQIAVQRAQLNLARALREEQRFGTEQSIRERSAVLDLQAADLGLTRAQNSLSDTIERGTRLQTELRDAELGVVGAHQQVEASTITLRDAETELNRITRIAKGGTEDILADFKFWAELGGPQLVGFLRDQQIPAVAELEGNYLRLQKAAEDARQAMIDASRTNQEINDELFARERRYEVGTATGTALQFGGDLPGAQFGMSLRGRRLVRVGEAGPEILAIQPRTRGHIYPNGRTPDGGGVQIGELHVHEVADSPEATGRKVAWEIGKQMGVSA